MGQVSQRASTNSPSPRTPRMKGVGLNTTPRLWKDCCGTAVGMEGHGFGYPKAVILRKLRRSMMPSIGACNLRQTEESLCPVIITRLVGLRRSLVSALSTLDLRVAALARVRE